jgi:hypothetical protein
VLLALADRLPDYQVIQREIDESRTSFSATTTGLSRQLTQLDSSNKQQLEQLRQQTSNPRLQLEGPVRDDCFDAASCSKVSDLGPAAGRFCALETVRLLAHEPNEAECSISVADNRWTLKAYIDRPDAERQVACAAQCVTFAVGAAQ